VRDQLFVKGEPVVGADITVNGINFQVIGVFESLQKGNQQQEGERIYLPNDTLRYSFNQTGWIGSFMILPKPGIDGIDAGKTEADVKAYLSQIKKVSPEDRGVFGSFNLQAEYDKVQSLLSNIRAFSWIVAIGTIFAGAIGVGVAVHHRDRGVRRAGRRRGADRRHRATAECARPRCRVLLPPRSRVRHRLARAHRLDHVRPVGVAAARREGRRFSP
jgi:putative ABC transport system permease protein